MTSDAATQNRRLAEDLARASAEVSTMVAEHLEDFDEVLATILLGAIGTWFVTSIDDGADNQAERDRVTAVLGEALQTGSDHLQTVVVTGFLESLPPPGTEGRGAVEHLPGPLRRGLADMEQALRDGR